MLLEGVDGSQLLGLELICFSIFVLIFPLVF
jgi:hypothetical protein